MTPAQLPADRPIGLLVPAYIYPAPGNKHWESLVLAARKIATTVIINPASGPGDAADQNYRQAIAPLNEAGARTVGYVHTEYGKRPAEQVMNEIALYSERYSLQGIFLDEMSVDLNPGSISYFQSIYQQIKQRQPDWTVIGNPGVRPDPSLPAPQLADTLVQFEQSSRHWHSSLTARQISRTGTTMAAQLVHSVASASQMHKIIESAHQNSVDFIYVTDRKPDNPWDSLPAYWDKELELLVALNAGTRANDQSG